MPVSLVKRPKHVTHKEMREFIGAVKVDIDLLNAKIAVLADELYRRSWRGRLGRLGRIFARKGMAEAS